MSTNPFDQACRYLAKLEPVALIAWLLRLPSTAFVFRRWLDARRIAFPGEPDRTCDTVAFLEDVAAGNVPWATPLEFQIEPDATMFGRFLSYLGTLWLELKPSPERGDRFCVGAILVNLTGKGEASRSMAWPAAGLATGLSVAERNLAGFSAAAVLDEIAAGTAPAVVLPWIPVMQGGAESDIIQRWKDLASRDPDARRRGDYGGLALVFAEAADCRDVWKEALKEWNVVQSKQVLEWQAKARDEGRDEGRVEGQAEGAARLLVKVLEARFGNLPPDLQSRIQNVRNVDILDRLGSEAARAPDLGEFLKNWPN